MNKQATRDKIATKVRALKDRTTDRGCTEAEAMTAASLAAKLMTEHDLTMTDVEIGESTCDTTFVNTGKKTTHEVRLAIKAIAFFTDTVAWRDRDEGVIRYAFFGLENDTEFAVYLHDVIRAAMDAEVAAYKSHQWLLDEPSGRSASHSFLVGMARRVSERLKELKRTQNASTIASTGRDLVVVKSHLVHGQFAQLGMRLRKGSATHSHDQRAHAAGKAAGDRVGFNRRIGDDSNDGYYIEGS